MPRSSYSSNKSKPSASAYAPVPFRNPMSSVAHPVPSAPTFGQTLKEGFALGTGSAIAHRMISSVFGAPTVNVQSSSSSQAVPEPCEKERTAFENCMKTKSTDDFCGEQQLSYTQCIRLSKESH